MKTSLIGTVFLFSWVFGQNPPSNEGKVQLVKNEIPCLKDKECQLKIGPMAQCKALSCMCPVNGQWRNCYVDESVAVMASQSRQLYHTDYNFCHREPDLEYRNRQKMHICNFTMKCTMGDSLVGYPCNSNLKCNIPHGRCNMETGKCDCVEGYIPSKDNVSCHRIADHLNDFCFEDLQCQIKLKNMICSEARRCECQENYHDASHECWKSVGYEESCKDDRECLHMFGHCNETSKICICNKDQIINGNKKFCLDIVRYEERCDEDVQCVLDNLQHSQCTFNTCSCNNGYHYSKSANNCIEDKVYGEICENEECYENKNPEVDENSLVCNSTKNCDCAEGFKLSVDKCLKIANSSSKIVLYPMRLILVTLLLLLL